MADEDRRARRKENRDRKLDAKIVAGLEELQRVAAGGEPVRVKQGIGAGIFFRQGDALKNSKLTQEAAQRRLDLISDPNPNRLISFAEAQARGQGGGLNPIKLFLRANSLLNLRRQEQAVLDQQILGATTQGTRIASGLRGGGAVTPRRTRRAQTILGAESSTSSSFALGQPTILGA